MDFTPLQGGLCGTPPPPPPPPRQLVNVTCLCQSKDNEQRDYVTVNYSVTLKLRVE